jgi:hypothetical protein
MNSAPLVFDSGSELPHKARTAPIIFQGQAGDEWARFPREV